MHGCSYIYIFVYTRSRKIDVFHVLAISHRNVASTTQENGGAECAGAMTAVKRLAPPLSYVHRSLGK